MVRGKAKALISSFIAALNETSVDAFNATFVHLMGFDHEQVAFCHSGFKHRLSNVHGYVLKDELA